MLLAWLLVLADLGQVYRGRLRSNGAEVAVKAEWSFHDCWSFSLTELHKWFCKAYRTIRPVLDYLRDFCLAKTLGNSLSIDMSIATHGCPHFRFSGLGWRTMHLHSHRKSQVQQQVQEKVGETQSQMQQDANGLEIYGKSIDRMNTPAGYPHSGHVHLQKAPKQGCSFFMPRLKWRSVEKLESLFGMQFLKCQQQLALATLEDPPQVIQRSILSAR